MDETQVIMAEAPALAPAPMTTSNTQSPAIVGAMGDVEGTGQGQGQNQGIQATTIEETQAEDIGVAKPIVPLGDPGTMAVDPYIGVRPNELQIIEMLTQHARGSLYNKTELRRGGLDSEMMTALAYNESKSRSLAVDEWNVRIDQSFKEGELTGFYLDPQNKELITQLRMAEYDMTDPNSTRAQRDKANDIIANVNRHFKANGLSMAGVKTLDRIVKEKDLDLKRAENARARAAAGNAIKDHKFAALMAVKGSLGTGATLAEMVVLHPDFSREELSRMQDNYNSARGSMHQIISKVLKGSSMKEIKAQSKDKKTGEYTSAGKRKIDGVERELWQYKYGENKDIVYAYLEGIDENNIEKINYLTEFQFGEAPKVGPQVTKEQQKALDAGMTEYAKRKNDKGIRTTNEYGQTNVKFKDTWQAYPTEGLLSGSGKVGAMFDFVKNKNYLSDAAMEEWGINPEDRLQKTVGGDHYVWSNYKADWIKAKDIDPNFLSNARVGGWKNPAGIIQPKGVNINGTVVPFEKAPAGWARDLLPDRKGLAVDQKVWKSTLGIRYLWDPITKDYINVEKEIKKSKKK